MYFESNLNISYISDFLVVAYLAIILILLPLLNKWFLNKHKLIVPIKITYLFVAILGWMGIRVMSVYDINAKVNQINSNDFKVVEGIPENFKKLIGNSKEESFSIKGVNFKYNNFSTSSLFFANRNNDFSLFDGSKILRVSYLEDGKQNLIFKIEHLNRD